MVKIAEEKRFNVALSLPADSVLLLQEWQQQLTIVEQQDIEADATKGNTNRTSLTVTTVDNTLLQTLHQQISLSTPPTVDTPNNRPCFGVLCFEDNLCLGEVLFNSPVLVIDGSDDDIIVSRIGFGSFPNCNSTSEAHQEQRSQIGLVVSWLCLSNNL